VPVKETDMKRCGCCKKEKQLSEFHKDRSKGDGLQSQCKACNADYKVIHKIEIAEQRRGHYQIHKGEIAERHSSPTGKEWQRKANKNQWEKYPEIRKAHNDVKCAIHLGKLERPLICEDCGEKKFVHAHHPDYHKPLEVNWLCLKCHVKLHRNLRLQEPVGIS